MRWSVALTVSVVLAGCVAKQATPSSGRLILDASDEAVLRSVTGPEQLRFAGLTARIPEGWVGFTGGGVALDVTHRASGVSVAVLAQGQAAGPTLKREGYTRMFEDLGSFRAVPLITPSGTATWRSDADDGRLVVEYWGAVGGRVVRIEVGAPSGRGAASLGIAAPLLTGLAEALAQDTLDE
jgi:hypothetical protein